MASSSSSSVPQKCQVFLTFRGKDTRNNFTSHLHAALKGKGIDTFVDYRLERGEGISQALSTAIEKSKISIIVLSKNYASSSWCLDELAKILECKKRYGQEVVPIFYHVDPSDVRNQKGSFEKAFAKHQQRFKDTVESWGAALKEVANLSGYHIQPHLPESTLIAIIVKDISKKLMYKSSYDTKRLVGIDSHIEKIESLLCIDSLDVRIIGIWGMAGIGKTTIAKAVYNRFFAEFDSCCFVNVKEVLKYGQVHLWEKLFSIILEDSDLNLDTSSLPTFTKERLQCKKIFIVLDDINDSTQLLDLLSEKDCFGPASRIIVISRDKQVLQQVIDEMYEVKGMVDGEALQLFSMCAFKQSHPKEDFMELSKKVIHFAKGVPLALRVVGSALYDKSKCVWEGHLNKLKNNSDLEIDKILRISYDGLDDEMKNIFLDIACFFRWKHKDYVENILDGCYSSAMSEISFLVDKCLITILDNMLEMHDLLQLMAWNIIREESNERGERSRLWTPEDIYHVLKNNTGTKSIKGMFLDMSKIGKLCLSPAAFKKMCNLKLLKFYYTNFWERNVYLPQQGLEYLPDSLSYLHWDDYPSKCLPSSFCPVNLVELSMPNSYVEQLWNGVQDLVKLKLLDLSGSQHLIKIPDLSRASNLEIMYLDGCGSLVEVPSSIRYLNKLSYLSLMWCQNLGNFPSNVGLSSLTTLLLDYCSNITKFPEISVNLVKLSLSGTAIEEVPSSIDRLSRLGHLNLTHCKRLKRLPSNICRLKFLKELDLTSCHKLESLPEILETTKYLKSLDLSDTSIEELPSSIELLVGLESLELNYCEKLKNLPISIRELKSLEKLSLFNCSNFNKFPEIPVNLRKLNLSETAIEQVPSSIERVSGLRDLYLETCTKLQSLPRNIFKLKNLCIFILSGFSKVEVIQELLGTIQVLKIHPSFRTASLQWSKANQGTLSLDELPDNVENLNSLKTLEHRNYNLFTFPIHLTCISSLTDLDLSGNNFETIPASIKQLLELESLDLSYCKRLQSLPELPPNLQDLNACYCSSLEAISSLFTLGHGKRINYSFANCLKLDENAISHLLSETQLWIDCQGIVDRSSLTICLPGSEIPEWFSCQNTGSSVTTQPPLYGDDRKFVGFVLCAVLAVEDFDGSLLVGVNCKHTFKTNNGCHCASYSFLVSSLISVGSDHMFLDYNWVDDWMAYDGFSEASFQFYINKYWAKCWVKKCGVHVLYRQNDQIISLPYNARVIQPIYNENLAAIQQLVPCQSSKGGGGSDSSDLPYTKDVEEFNSIMIGVNNQDFGESTVEDGTIIKRCRSDYCYDEAEASGSFDPGRDTIMIQPSSLNDSTWLSLNCGVIDQGFGEPMQEEGTIIKRCYDEHHNNEAEPSGNFSSNENCTLPVTIHQLLPCQPSKGGSGSDSSDLPYAKDAEESNSIMIYQPSSSSDPAWLSLRCGVNNQDFEEPVVEDGTIIKGCCSDYCYDEAEASGSLDPGRDTIMIQPSSPYDSTWLSLNCGVIDQGFAEPVQEDGTVIKRCHDDHHNNETEPSESLNSEQEEEQPHSKRLKTVLSCSSQRWW